MNKSITVELVLLKSANEMMIGFSIDEYFMNKYSIVDRFM